jgi:hypothetical protein
MYQYIYLQIHISKMRDHMVICKNYFKISDFINYNNKIPLTKETVPSKFAIVTYTFLFKI